MKVSSTDRIVASVSGDQRHTDSCIRNGYGRDYGCTCEAMTDYTDPESPVADPHAEERKRYYSMYRSDTKCFWCGLEKQNHINDTYCPEWRLRQLDGDR